MKKENRRVGTGNLAKRRLKKSGSDGGRHRSWLQWLGREIDALLSLPEWLSTLILLLVAGTLLTVWRLFSG